MTMQAADTAVRHEVVVNAPTEHAGHVSFTDLGDGTTRAELEHRHLDRHGEGWEGVREAVGSADGWPGSLEAYAAKAAEVA